MFISVYVAVKREDVIGIYNLFSRNSIKQESVFDRVLVDVEEAQNWVKGLALLVRGVLFEHIFADCSKQTAALLILTYTKIHNHDVNPRLVNECIRKISDNQITSLLSIERLLNNVVH